VALSALMGRGRFGYGQPGLLGQPRYKRTSKKEGLVSTSANESGRYHPDDLERVETPHRERAGLGPAGPTVSAPFHLIQLSYARALGSVRSLLSRPKGREERIDIIVALAALNTESEAIAN